MVWTLRDVLAHGVFGCHPVVTGTATHVADHMQNWLGAGACDGFSQPSTATTTGIAAFVDEDVPVLQERGPFRLNYDCVGGG
jgi:alkanesulfonate monooxygenase SsuD/methylene tetrahydromethanopterin reductase-like flavin-dependent oxidoreductase (luciferase family)